MGWYDKSVIGINRETIKTAFFQVMRILLIRESNLFWVLLNVYVWVSAAFELAMGGGSLKFKIDMRLLLNIWLAADCRIEGSSIDYLYLRTGNSSLVISEIMIAHHSAVSLRILLNMWLIKAFLIEILPTRIFILVIDSLKITRLTWNHKLGIMKWRLVETQIRPHFMSRAQTWVALTTTVQIAIHGASQSRSVSRTSKLRIAGRNRGQLSRHQMFILFVPIFLVILRQIALKTILRRELRLLSKCVIQRKGTVDRWYMCI